jgi:hypothetical protein
LVSVSTSLMLVVLRLIRNSRRLPIVAKYTSPRCASYASALGLLDVIGDVLADVSAIAPTLQFIPSLVVINVRLPPA